MTRPLDQLLSSARVLLLDFDGPVCSVFAGYPAPVIAAQLRELAARLGADPASLDGGNDPLQLLRSLPASAPSPVVRAVADALRDAEVTAVATARPTPHIGDLLRAAHYSGRIAAIVSNNSAAAVRSYLDRHDLSPWVDQISARIDGMDPALLKPHPHLVRQALTALHVQPGCAIFIGDTRADVAAGRAAGVSVIGYANKPGKHDDLADADGVIDDVRSLVDALAL
ncbi:MAG TPA: HAD-IA family hydrolase [Micromonosporaceae bacterium]|nr:HAD-IA family hydrolase [Micromonosporaceae bacterium]